MRTTRFCSLAALGLVTSLAAQRRWIVDEANGPGTDFTTLPPAIAAANDGDTVLIRAGNYTPITTSKGLTLLGVGAATIRQVDFVFAPVVEITGLPASRSFVMKGLRIEGIMANALFSATGNAGRIHLEDVEIATATIPPAPQHACVVSNCRSFTMNGGRLFGFPSVRVIDSTAAFTGTRIEGGHSCGSVRCTYVGEGLISDRSTLHLTNCNVTGGNGGAPLNPFTQPRTAVQSAQSTIYAAGDTTTVSAGSGGTAILAGITTDQGRVELDAAVVVNGLNGGPDIGGTATVVRRPIVGLRARGVPPGGTIATRVTAPASDLFALFLGVPGDAIALPLGVLYLDPVAHVLVTLGIGPTDVPIPVPAVPSLGGAAFALQASCSYGGTQRIELSNPVVVVLH